MRETETETEIAEAETEKEAERETQAKRETETERERQRDMEFMPQTCHFWLGFPKVDVKLLIQVVGDQSDVIVGKPFQLQLVGHG